MIELDHLTVAYGAHTALRKINLTIRPGETVGLLGPNGSGKTTLLHTVSGVLKPKSGAIRINGRPLADIPPRERARLMASTPQRAETCFSLRGETLVLMGRYPHLPLFGGYSDDDRRIVREAMRQTRTEAFADRPAGELSGGEFQRLLLARALAQQADILLLDEATSGLDIARKMEIHDLIAERNKQGATIIASIHDLNLAALYCGRLVILKHGRVACDGPTREIFTEQTLSRIYETDIKVFKHPAADALQCLPVPGVSASAPRRRPD